MESLDKNAIGNLWLIFAVVAITLIAGIYLGGQISQPAGKLTGTGITPTGGGPGTATPESPEDVTVPPNVIPLGGSKTIVSGPGMEVVASVRPDTGIVDLIIDFNGETTITSSNTLEEPGPVTVRAEEMDKGVKIGFYDGNSVEIEFPKFDPEGPNYEEREDDPWDDVETKEGIWLINDRIVGKCGDGACKKCPTKMRTCLVISNWAWRPYGLNPFDGRWVRNMQSINGCEQKYTVNVGFFGSAEFTIGKCEVCCTEDFMHTTLPPAPSS
ncbi:MAG: hypothetical protein V1744_04790 [Candidatus Altiarchaeota archaeon]